MTFAQRVAHSLIRVWLVGAASLAVACNDDGPEGGGSTGVSSSGTSADPDNAEGGESTGNDPILEEYCTCMLFRCRGHYDEL